MDKDLMLKLQDGRLLRLDADKEDAEALRTIATRLVAARKDLEADGSKYLGLYNSEVIKRAGRILVEEIWEKKRRRKADAAVMSDKYALGGLWTPAAKLLACGDQTDWLPGEPWGGGKLQLEHVVPATTIVKIVGDPSINADDLPDALHAVVNHVVTLNDNNFLKGEQKDAPQGVMLASDEAALLELLRTKPWDESRLMELVWARYLHDKALPYSVAELGPVKEHVDQPTSAWRPQG